MKTQFLGTTDISVTRLSYGAMRISGTWDRTKVDAAAISRGIKILESVVDSGYTFIDHADIYGDTSCEKIYGIALKDHPDWRNRLVVATKCGIRFENDPPGAPHRYDLSSAHLIKSVEASLQRLNLDRIDLLQFHRPDYLLDPYELARAMVELQKSGKVRSFGVSNFKPSQVNALQNAMPFPLASNQVRISLMALGAFDDGSIDQCLEKKMSVMAYSPLAGGQLAGAFDENAPSLDSVDHAITVARLRPVLSETANAYGVTPLAIILAWLMHHPSKIIPIIGSTRPEVIQKSVQADNVTLDRESWYRILLAARGEKLA